jgi:SAM-dependent methyltransferase
VSACITRGLSCSEFAIAISSPADNASLEILAVPPARTHYVDCSQARHMGAGLRVLDVGAGSGLLSMMAARAGAERVDAVEANPDYARLAAAIVRRNGLAATVSVHQALSTAVTLQPTGGGGPRPTPGVSAAPTGGGGAASDARETIKMPGVGRGRLERKADVLVAETIGTLLLSESQLDYMEDARKRLLKPGGAIIPAAGVQYHPLFCLAKPVHHSHRLRCADDDASCAPESRVDGAIGGSCIAGTSR